MRFQNFQCHSAWLARGGKRRSQLLENAARLEFGRRWDNKTQQERSDWERVHVAPILWNDLDLPQKGPPDLLDVLNGVAVLEPPVIDYAAHSRQTQPFDLYNGDGKWWPIAEEDFIAHLQREAVRMGMTQFRGGCLRPAGSIRQKMRSDICVVDKDDALDPVLVVDHPCGVKHPGLCCTRDATVYDFALDIAAAIHRVCKPLGSGTFVGFHAPAYSCIFCVAVLRLSDPQLAVMAECVMHFGGDEGGDGQQTISIRSPAYEFAFKTHYAIAADLARACNTANPSDGFGFSVFDVRSLHPWRVAVRGVRRQ